MIRKVRATTSLALLALLFLLLSACAAPNISQTDEGTGASAVNEAVSGAVNAGGGSADNTPEASEPSANAGADATVNSGANDAGGSSGAVPSNAGEPNANTGATAMDHSGMNDAMDNSGISATPANEPADDHGSGGQGRDDSGTDDHGGKSSDDKAASSQPKATASATAKPAETAKPAVSAKPAASAKPTPSNSKAEVHVVEIKGFAFSPASLEIKKGDIVRFVNRDDVKHTATADDDSFDTGLIAKDAGVEVTFKEAGTFTYFCTPHPFMTGTIIVKE